MDKPGFSTNQDGPVDSDIECHLSYSSSEDEAEEFKLYKKYQKLKKLKKKKKNHEESSDEDIDDTTAKKNERKKGDDDNENSERPKRKRSNTKNTQENEGEELENKKKKKPHNEKKPKRKEDGEEGGSVVHEVSNLPYTNLRSPTLAARHGAGDNTAPVPHNEAGPSATANLPSTANNDSSTTSDGQMAPEGNNVVPVMTGEKTSVGEVRIDNSTQLEQIEKFLQADLPSVYFGLNSNQGGSVVHEVSNLPYTNLRSPTLAARHAAGDNTAPVPHNEAGPSATANFPSTATNDSSTTSHGRMAPGERDLAREQLAKAASQALEEILKWFPAIDPSQVEVSETSLGRLGLLTCPMCQIKIQSKYRPTFKGKEWSTAGVTKHIPLCIIEKFIRKEDIMLVLGLKG